jgi:hypothetical protein
MMSEPIDSALRTLDIGIFAPISAQLTDADKRSLLAIQQSLREQYAGYTYLEIGSHLGGSLQPHVLDSRCATVISIDARPLSVADDRVDSVPYPRNSTEHMMTLLREVAGDRVRKIVTFDADAAAVDPGALPSVPHLCLIDGEHTERAALSDFAFCKQVVRRRGGVLAFHDGNIIFPALDRIVRELRAEGEQIRAYILPSTVFVIEFGEARIHQSEAIRDLLLNNGEPYLYGLMSMLHYRDVYSSRPMQFMRQVWHMINPSPRPWRT